MRSVIFSIPLFIAAGAAAAQSSGTATVTIDGEELAFKTVASASEWDGPDYARSATLIMFSPDAIDRFRWLWIMFDVWEDGAKPDQVVLEVVTSDGVVRHIGSDETGMTVDLDHASLDGSVLKLEGQFETQAGASSDYGNTIDLSDPTWIAGTFSVALEKTQ